MDTNSSRIYILDDEEIFSFSIQHHLKKAGFSDIHLFETSEARFEKMHEQPDVLILDHFLHNEIWIGCSRTNKQTNKQTNKHNQRLK